MIIGSACLNDAFGVRSRMCLRTASYANSLTVFPVIVYRSKGKEEKSERNSAFAAPILSIQEV